MIFENLEWEQEVKARELPNVIYSSKLFASFPTIIFFCLTEKREESFPSIVHFNDELPSQLETSPYSSFKHLVL